MTEQETRFADAWEGMVEYSLWMDRRWPESARAGVKVAKLKLELLEAMHRWHEIVDRVAEEDDPDLDPEE